MSEHTCVVCPQLRSGEPRIYERPNVCEGCRSRLRGLLAELPEAYAAHVDSYRELLAETRTWDWIHTDPDGTVHHITHADPVASALPAAGRYRDPRSQPVSGSRTPPLPAPADALDLTLPARLSAVSDDLVPLYVRSEAKVRVWDPAAPERCDCSECLERRRQPGYVDAATYAQEYTLHEVILSQRVRRRDEHGWLAYGPSGDQAGELSAPTVLDSWARDWQSYEWALLPEPAVTSLVTWLTRRLEWACDHHPAIDDFAFELDDLARRLRPRGARAELKRGVPCRECEAVTLYRWPGSDYIECGSCPVLMSPEEYERWTQLISAPEHQPWVREIVASQREGAA